MRIFFLILNIQNLPIFLWLLFLSKIDINSIWKKRKQFPDKIKNIYICLLFYYLALALLLWNVLYKISKKIFDVIYHIYDEQDYGFRHFFDKLFPR